MTERVSPRIFRVVALPAPTEREKSQMYAQRYIPHLPAAGEMMIFDRSRYNRAGVQRVRGLCTEDQVKRFLEMVPAFETVVVDSRVILLKYWLEVGPDEQTRRLEARIYNVHKVMDQRAGAPNITVPAGFPPGSRAMPITSRQRARSFDVA